MRLRVLAIGRARHGALNQAAADFARRLGRHFSLRELTPPNPNISGQLPELQSVREGTLLLSALPDGKSTKGARRDNRVVALDRRGKTLDSEALANQLGQWRDAGVPTTSFLLGGTYGLSDEIRKRADLILSFGPMTWPHLLSRVMLLEQLYRVQQILAGHPYHHAG